MESDNQELKEPLWKLIKESIKGGDRDFTSGKISTAIILLAIPMILELGMESVFAVVDIYFVGTLGEAAIAAVGLTESVVSLVYSVAIGLSTAATAIIARRIGEKKPELAGRAAAQTIVLSSVVAVVISIFGYIYASDILEFMGGESEVITGGAGYTRLIFVTSITIILLFLINGIFRGAGNAAMAMKSLWLASIINIILDPIFIWIYGIEGAAIATAIGRGTGVLYQVYFLATGKSMVKIKLADFKPNLEPIKNIVKIAWPATLQFLIASGSWVFLSKIVAETGGTSATAGYQVAIRNVIFFILPAWGLSNAAATLVGQNLGAGKPERAVKSVYLAVKYNAVFMGIVSLIFIAIPDLIMSIFTKNIDVIDYGANALRIIGFGYTIYGVGMVLTQSLNGAGDTKSPTVINLIGFWAVQIPLAYLLAYYTGLSQTGVFIAIPISEALIAVMSYWVFRRGKWKSVEV
ncbi:MAG: MATE family efflux transporter [Candidatus Kapaibacteriales bacterium]